MEKEIKQNVALSLLLHNPVIIFNSNFYIQSTLNNFAIWEREKGNREGKTGILIGTGITIARKFA